MPPPLLPALAALALLLTAAGGVVRTVAEPGRTSVSLIDVPGGAADIVAVRDAVLR